MTDQPREFEKAWREAIKLNREIGIEMDIQRAPIVAFWRDEPRDTPIARRRKLNGDTR